MSCFSFKELLAQLIDIFPEVDPSPEILDLINSSGDSISFESLVDIFIGEPELTTARIQEDEKLNNYASYFQFDDYDIVKNSESSKCSLCKSNIASKKGVLLKECLHTFCR